MKPSKISKLNSAHQKFWWAGKLNKISPYKVLLYYSTIFSTILIIGGFWTARSGKGIISNLLFLPIVVFLWIVLIKHKKENKVIKAKRKIVYSLVKDFGKGNKKNKD